MGYRTFNVDKLSTTDHFRCVLGGSQTLSQLPLKSSNADAVPMQWNIRYVTYVIAAYQLGQRYWTIVLIMKFFLYFLQLHFRFYIFTFYFILLPFPFLNFITFLFSVVFIF